MANAGETYQKQVILAAILFIEWHDAVKLTTP
jgi:hypothetical protein